MNYPYQMPYQTNYNMPTSPYNAPQTSFQPQGNQLIRVSGIDGAKAYTMPPNSMCALFDNADDYMYIKVTDGAGFGTIRKFKFTEVLSNQEMPQADYVTRKDMEEYVKQFIQPRSTTEKQKSNGNSQRDVE